MIKSGVNILALFNTKHAKYVILEEISQMRSIGRCRKQKIDMAKIYKEANKSETETTVNVLYSEKILSILTKLIQKEDFAK